MIGAIAWAIIAFVRGETVNAVWLVVAAICTYIIGFRFYARLIEMKIVRPRDDHATPAEIFDNGTDYVPTDRRVLFGHHFAAIAGAGPLVGPVLATQMGYLPCSIWIVIGAVLGGCVQDYLVLWISTRRRGRSLGQMAREELGATAGAAALVGVLVIMVILIAVLALIVVKALAESPWGVFSIAMTIPIALFMGCYLRFLRPGRVGEVSVIGAALLLLDPWPAAAGSPKRLGAHHGSTCHRSRCRWLIIVYGFAASVLPVWLLLAPRDYLSTFMKVGTIALLAIGIFIAHPVLQAPAISQFATRGDGPVFAGSLFPFLFITIACGALSGFHSLISSGTTPKLLEKESQMRVIGYGGMITESFVAIMALITASIINQHLYFTLNAPAAQTGGTAATAAEYVNRLGLSGAPATADADQRGRQRRRRALDRVAHRRSADAGVRHVRRAAPRFRRRQPQGVLVPLRDHVRGAVHPDHRRRGHPGRAFHALRRAGQFGRSAGQAAEIRAGAPACGSAAWPWSPGGAASC